jgi:hypothetical protein
VLKVNLAALSDYIMPVIQFDWNNSTTEGLTSFILLNWKTFQPASFCLTAHALAGGCIDPQCYHLWRPDHELDEINWIYFDLANCTQDHIISFAPLTHTVANLVVLKILVSFQAYSSRDKAFLQHWRNTQILSDEPKPPTLWQIPFMENFKTILPSFSNENNILFYTFHLASMATPEFMIEGAWTGYIMQPVHRRSNFHPLDAVGHQFKSESWTSESIPTVSDGLIYFSLHETINNSQFIIKSNKFILAKIVRSMELTIDSKTGLFSVKWSSIGYPDLPEPLPGVITPFGLVIRDLRGRWFWLWKSGWTVQNSVNQ